MNQVFALLLDKLKAKNPTVFFIVACLLGATFYSLDFLQTSGVALPVWASSAATFLKGVVVLLGFGLNAQTKQFRTSVVFGCLMLLGFGSMAQGQSQTDLPINSQFTAKEMLEVLQGNSQIVLHATWYKDPTPASPKPVKKPKNFSLDTLQKAMQQAGLLGGGGGVVTPPAPVDPPFVVKSTPNQSVTFNASNGKFTTGGASSNVLMARDNQIAISLPAVSTTTSFCSVIRVFNTEVMITNDSPQAIEAYDGGDTGLFDLQPGGQFIVVDYGDNAPVEVTILCIDGLYSVFSQRVAAR